MKTGSITNAKLLNGWELVMQKADKLPQDLISADAKLFGTKLGGSYTPIFYVAEQEVNGKNHKLVYERTKQVSGGKTVKDYAVIVINIPAGDVRADKATVVSEEDVTDFVLRDEIEVGVKKAFADFSSTNHKPILELGEQVVKGINYVFICESKGNYSDSEPYLTMVAINNFQDKWTIDQIERI